MLHKCLAQILQYASHLTSLLYFKSSWAYWSPKRAPSVVSFLLKIFEDSRLNRVVVGVSMVPLLRGKKSELAGGCTTRSVSRYSEDFQTPDE